jgi:hypothetical protein
MTLGPEIEFSQTIVCKSLCSKRMLVLMKDSEEKWILLVSGDIKRSPSRGSPENKQNERKSRDVQTAVHFTPIQANHNASI